MRPRPSTPRAFHDYRKSNDAIGALLPCMLNTCPLPFASQAGPSEALWLRRRPEPASWKGCIGAILVFFAKLPTNSAPPSVGGCGKAVTQHMLPCRATQQRASSPRLIGRLKTPTCLSCVTTIWNRILVLRKSAMPLDKLAASTATAPQSSTHHSPCCSHQTCACTSALCPDR